MHARGKKSKPKPPKSEKRRRALQASANKRLTDQTRKILSKHYANKYRVR